jgi:UDP-N-acetyl-D-mannosaminuronic acid transferase (WecB/TagA/CpsF family)
MDTEWLYSLFRRPGLKLRLEYRLYSSRYFMVFLSTFRQMHLGRFHPFIGHEGP